MNDLEEKFHGVVAERGGIVAKINALLETETVKEYLELCEQNEKLFRKQKDLYKKIKVKEYSSCKHIWVNTFFAGYKNSYHGCVKCGLDERVLYLAEHCRNLDYLTFEERVMYDFMRDQSNDPEEKYLGIDSNLLCDLDLATAIYKKIKEVHPYIDDELAVKYLEASLHKIRNIEVSDERKENRAKRLSLKPDFSKWTESDVMKY